MRRALHIAFHTGMIVLLTLLTQIGGLLWLAVAVCVPRKVASGWQVVFLLTLVVLIVPAYHGLAGIAANLAGREPLPACDVDPFARPPKLRPASGLTCALHRHYVKPELRDVLFDLAEGMRAADPAFVRGAVHYLDANLPAIDGFPLLPHLSHDDGLKVDLAFVYRDGKGPVLDTTKSRRLGYWAFEEPRPGDPQPCRGRCDLLTLRWDMGWLRLPGLFRDRLALDEERTARMVRLLAADPRVTKILLEPHLVRRLGVAHPKVRFQGCRAARHDDHLHVEVAG